MKQARNPKLTDPSLPHLSCGFCGKNNAEVKMLIAGPITQICNECVVMAVEILHEKGLIKFNEGK